MDGAVDASEVAELLLKLKCILINLKIKIKSYQINQIKIIQKKKSNNLLVSSIVASSFGNQENQEMTEFQFFNDQTP